MARLENAALKAFLASHNRPPARQAFRLRTAGSFSHRGVIRVWHDPEKSILGECGTSELKSCRAGVRLFPIKTPSKEALARLRSPEALTRCWMPCRQAGQIRLPAPLGHKGFFFTSQTSALFCLFAMAVKSLHFVLDGPRHDDFTTTESKGGSSGKMGEIYPPVGDSVGDEKTKGLKISLKSLNLLGSGARI